MPYTPDPTNAAAPLDNEIALTAAAEFRSLKAYITKMPVEEISANYAFVNADAGKCKRHPLTDANDRNWTIPDGLQVGTLLTIVNRVNTIFLSMSGAEVLVLAGNGATGVRTLPAFTVCTVFKDSATTWIISGTGVA